MFTFVETLTFWWPVKVLEPDPAKPGVLVEKEFEIQIELPDPDEAKAEAKQRRDILAKMLDASGDELDGVQAELDLFDAQLGLKRVRDWRNIQDETGTSLPFSLFPQVFKHDRIKSAVTRAYIDSVSEDRARLGNSQTPQRSGRGR